MLPVFSTVCMLVEALGQSPPRAVLPLERAQLMAGAACAEETDPESSEYKANGRRRWRP